MQPVRLPGNGGAGDKGRCWWDLGPERKQGGICVRTHIAAARPGSLPEGQITKVQEQNRAEQEPVS